MQIIDGAQGEGGGQILRTSLALSMITGRPCRLQRIRANRRKPGLMRQHLAAVRAAATVCGGCAAGAELGASEITFDPGPVHGGAYHFAVGSAGSACLVLQTVLPALLRAAAPSRLTVEGGTHNPHAPPFDFLSEVFFPLLRRMGVDVQAHLERAGFYPAGGGRITVHVAPAPALKPLELLDAGAPRGRRARALVCGLPEHIARRELAVLERRLRWSAAELEVERVRAPGQGNALLVRIERDQLTELFTGFGERGVRAETVASRVADEVLGYLARDAPVGPHLADQLLLPLVIAGGGAFRTGELTEHARTNIAVIQRFVDVPIRVEPEPSGTVLVRVG